MLCYQCRAQIPEDAKSCPKCGAEQGFSQELIRSACNGDQEAIAELYNRTYNSVYRTASYSVTLKAFRTSSDQEQSTIFEATAYPEEGNLVMTIDGQTVRIVPGGDAVAGFYLEVPDELQQQWGLDPYTLESLYISLS